LSLAEATKQPLLEAGISPEGFLAHSFCSGAATTAAQKGISEAYIKQLGVWKSQARGVKVLRETPSLLVLGSATLAGS